VGKKLAAVYFACLLNCPDPVTDQDNSCPTCRRIIEEKHPDVVIERPGKNIIRIERIRSIQSFFRYAPVEGRWRVTIIDDAHLMNRSAQNALLKTLEEPPPNRLLVLVTAKPFLLLSTVRSRCRRVRFGPIPKKALAAILRERRGLSSEKASLLATMGAGSLSRAADMDSPGFLKVREQVISALAESGRIGISGILELSAAISADRGTAAQAIDVAKTWIRDLLTFKVAPESAAVVNQDRLDTIAAEAQHHCSEDLLSVYDELVEAQGLIDADINVNRNMVTDVMLLRIVRKLAGPSFGLAKAAR
jgi:DNA polymerase III subunit delta'